MGFHCGQPHWISKTVSGSKYEGGPCRTAFHLSTVGGREMSFPLQTNTDTAAQFHPRQQRPSRKIQFPPTGGRNSSPRHADWQLAFPNGRKFPGIEYCCCTPARCGGKRTSGMKTQWVPKPSRQAYGKGWGEKRSAVNGILWANRWWYYVPDKTRWPSGVSVFISMT